MIAIVDYDIGNLAAIANMLQRLGHACEITGNADRVEQADRIILPGNGAFDACVSSLRASGLVPVLERKVLEQHVPLLGICVGAQMLGTGSEEGREPGLGWLAMHVRRFPARADLRVPHMGWNEVTPAQPAHPLSSGIEEGARFYFVHSYFMDPQDPQTFSCGPSTGCASRRRRAREHRGRPVPPGEEPPFRQEDAPRLCGVALNVPAARDPCLLLRGNGLVKTRRFRDPSTLGIR